MLVVGLTGTIASGKNFVCDNFSKLGAVIFDADKEVHDILSADKEVFLQIKNNFPDSIVDKKIDRKKLGDLVFDNKKKLEILEKIIHPVVSLRREDFIQGSLRSKRRLVILNIPLLFEKNIDLDCHKTILVTSPKLIQKQRFLKRAKDSNKNFDKDLFVKKFENILQNQIPNIDKEKVVDFVINNGQSEAFTFSQVKKIFNQLTK